MEEKNQMINEEPQYQEREIPAEQHTIYSLYINVKLQILERHYALLNSYSKYHTMAISGKDNENVRRELTTAILTQWLLLKDYKKSFEGLADFNKLNDFSEKVMSEFTIMTKEGISKCIKFLSSMMVKSGLTDIQREVDDPGKASRVRYG